MDTASSRGLYSEQSPMTDRIVVVSIRVVSRQRAQEIPKGPTR